MDRVLYSWTFDALNDLICDEASLGLVLELCISSDLNNKIQNVNSREGLVRYASLLEGILMGLSVAADAAPGDPQPEAVKARWASQQLWLEEYRGEHRISDAEHVGILRKLDWTENEFSAGQKLVGQR